MFHVTWDDNGCEGRVDRLRQDGFYFISNISYSHVGLDQAGKMLAI